MIEAFILCDFDNPLSMRYLEHSLESFKPVEDIVNITPVQCDTPATTPIHHPAIRRPFREEDYAKLPSWIDLDDPNDSLADRHIGGAFYDTPEYNAIAYSHLKLIKRIAEGEPIAIMEHDAALINEESFRDMIDECWGEVDFFIPGTCMEFYGMSSRFAADLYEHMYNLPEYPGNHYSGFFGVACSYHEEFSEADLFLLPSKAVEDVDRNFLCHSMSQGLLARGIESWEPACKQFLYRDKDNNPMNTNYEKYTQGKGVWEHMGIKGGPTYDDCFVYLDPDVD